MFYLQRQNETNRKNELKNELEKCKSQKHMVWYGMVQYGIVWYGIVWYSMVWYEKLN